MGLHFRKQVAVNCQSHCQAQGNIVHFLAVRLRHVERIDEPVCLTQQLVSARSDDIQFLDLSKNLFTSHLRKKTMALTFFLMGPSNPGIFASFDLLAPIGYKVVLRLTIVLKQLNGNSSSPLVIVEKKKRQQCMR